MNVSFFKVEPRSGFYVEQRDVNIPQGGIETFYALCENSTVIATAINSELGYLNEDYNLVNAPKWVRAVVNCWAA